MPTDEDTHGVDADASRERTGPRHAAPRKPLLARLHVPAGRAIALAAMPTVLVGMGLTSTLARAEGQQPVSKSLTAEEYQACVEAMAKEPTASPSPSASESSASSSDDKDDKGDKKDSAAKDDSASDSGSDDKGSSGSEEKDDDKAGTPSPSPSASGGTTEESGGDDAAASPSPSPSASEESKGLLETIGDALTDVFTGGSGSTASEASPSPSATPSASPDAAAGKGSASTEKKAADTTEDATKESPAADDDSKASPSPSPSASESSSSDDEKADASPSPSPSASTDVADCPVATDDEGGIDNKMRLPDDPWYLNASGLLLKGADYQGVVKVKTANGTVKEVLKYVISGGTDIDDLHQTVIDKQAGKTYHVKGAKGSKSTITKGDTIMYTESISGNLFGLLPVTFSPKSPPPLNIPLIYFSNVKVTQAGQFGGTLHIPGMTQSIT
ncbi:hypothetical protein ABZX85_01335 [Streptomyces sp. NPDC004539]|uniref:hypothetical protein n=1 Tax=Streptomyces sp. NPDC004539 TaxID=3154280 RepID=UPI0033A39825